MKHKRFLSIFGIMLVVTLLLALVPATPAFAYAITVTPASAKVGDTVTYSASGYVSTSETEYVVDVYLTDQAAVVGSAIGSTITRYKLVAAARFVENTTGLSTGTFLVPQTLNEGTVGAATPLALTAGATVYVCVSQKASGATYGTANLIVAAVTPMTVTANAVLNALSPVTGPAGTAVTVSGTSFPASTQLVFRLDSTTTLTPTAGDAVTTTAGAFSSTVSIPAGTTVGAHVINVTAGTAGASATFTVTVNPSLSPLSPLTGLPGTDVSITGADFPANTAVTFQVDGVFVTPKAGSLMTGGNGAFMSIITIPATAIPGGRVITVTVGTVTQTATFTVTGTPTLSPLTPATGLAGTAVTIAGTNFPAGNLTITLDGTAVTPSGSTATAGGAFSSVIVIPTTATAGAHTIAVSVGTMTPVTATFTVTAPTTTPTTTAPPVVSSTTTPAVTTTPSNVLPANVKPTTMPTTPSVNKSTTVQMASNVDNVGGTVNVVGMSFKPGAQVMFKFDDNSMAVVNASNDGVAVASFVIPPAAHGAHTIWAADAYGDWSSTTFNVEATAPGVPQPLKPLLYEKVKSPYTFSWGMVDDPSKPVTYELQVSSDPAFAADKLLVNKTGLTVKAGTLSVSYVLTTEEAAKLVGGVTYYWRERAVDGAINAGTWSGAAQFTITPPFKFTGWPMYVTIGVGAVLVFLLGLFVGKRTAFYY